MLATLGRRAFDQSRTPLPRYSRKYLPNATRRRLTSGFRRGSATPKNGKIDVLKDGGGTMTPKVSHYLHRTVMVSVPALFNDGACREFTLLGAELHGLWLQSDELTRRLLPGDQQHLAATATAAVFVPDSRRLPACWSPPAQQQARRSSSRRLRRPTLPPGAAGEPGRDRRPAGPSRRSHS